MTNTTPAEGGKQPSAATKSGPGQAPSSPNGWRPASETETAGASPSVDELRSKLSGWHFAKESLTDGEREILAVAEAVLAELDRRDDDGYAR